MKTTYRHSPRYTVPIGILIGSLVLPWVSLGPLGSISYVMLLWETLRSLTSGGDLGGAGARAWLSLGYWFLPAVMAAAGGWAWLKASPAAMKRLSLALGVAGIGWFIAAPSVTSLPFSSLMTLGGIAFAGSAVALVTASLKPETAGAPALAADRAYRAPASSSQADCGSCGARMQPGERFCGECGAPAAAAAAGARCPSCGSAAQAGAPFCGSCGASLQVRNESRPGQAAQPPPAASVRKPAGGGKVLIGVLGAVAAVVVWYGYSNNWKLGSTPAKAGAGSPSAQPTSPPPGGNVTDNAALSTPEGQTDDPLAQGSQHSQTTELSPQQPSAEPRTFDDVAAKASSSEARHPPSHAVDGDLNTYWHTGHNDRNPWISVRFPSERYVSEIGVIIGRGGTWFDKNARVKYLVVRFPDGDSEQLEFDDTRAMQYRKLSKSYLTAGVQFRIAGSYSGATSHVVIPEIEVRGYGPGPTGPSGQFPTIENVRRNNGARVPDNATPNPGTSNSTGETGDGGFQIDIKDIEKGGQLYAEMAMASLNGGDKEAALMLAKEAIKQGLKKHPVFDKLGLKP